MSDIKTTFDKEGIVHFKNIFSDKEKILLRNQVTNIFNKNRSYNFFADAQNLSNCSYNYPELNWVTMHEKVLSSVREVLGTNDIMYTSILGIQKNMLSSWHKDDGTSGNRNGYFNKKDYESETKVVRLGIYFQKHNKKNIGLGYIRGSHLNQNLSGKKEFIENDAFDLIIFDCRLTHAGRLRSKYFYFIKKLIPKFIFGFWDSLYLLLDNLLLKILRKEKIALFCTFGKNTDETITFSANMIEGQIKQSGGKKRLQRDIIKQYKEKNITCACEFF